MVSQRESIISHAKSLADLVIEGLGATPHAVRKAEQIKSFIKTAGTYQRKYEDADERTLNRHLNLYRNKLAAAQTTAEKARWQGKIHEQEIKIRQYKDDGGLTSLADMKRPPELDLDGL